MVADPGPDIDYIFKLLVIGDSGVGKSSLLRRFVDDVYLPEHASTIGVDFAQRTLSLDGKRVKLQVWDTAGSERFRAVTSGYYRGAHGIIVVFDVADKRSFEHVRYWIAEAGRHSPTTAQRMLVGNKSDLAGTTRFVSSDEAVDLAEGLGIPFVEASAKSAENVDRAFVLLAQAIKASVIRETPPIQSLETAQHGASSQSVLGPATPLRRPGPCRRRGECLLRLFVRGGGDQPAAGNGCCH